MFTVDGSKARFDDASSVLLKGQVGMFFARGAPLCLSAFFTALS
jgi:hypothetical protein